MLGSLTQHVRTSFRFASRRYVSSDTKLLLKPLPCASVGSVGHWFTPQKTNAAYHGAHFTLVLKPFPRHLTKADGSVDHSRLVPSWLPPVPHPSTHERRHLRDVVLPLYPEVEVDEEGGEKWNPTPATVEALAAGLRNQRPILRTFVMTTKRRIHKLAVIRNRVRTRLVAALRQALHQMQSQERDGDKDIVKALQVERNVVMIIASPAAYAREMDELIAEMRTAVTRITSQQQRTTSIQPQRNSRPQSTSPPPARKHTARPQQIPPPPARKDTARPVLFRNRTVLNPNRPV